MLTTDVRCRIDAKTKADAAEVIEALGLNVSDAIRLFLKRVATEGAIPFELRVPNAVTLSAIGELENKSKRSKLNKHKSLEAMSARLSK